MIQIFSAMPQAGRRSIGVLPPFYQRSQNPGPSAGLARHQFRVDDDLAQLSEGKLVNIGDEHRASTLYALGQMSHCDTERGQPCERGVYDGCSILGS